jgi:hypothetical protein
MKTIKFRRPYFKYKDNAFSHFSYWGVNLPFKESVTEFTSPSTNNTCFHKEDQQFTGLIDRHGKEIYEGDILNKKTTFENNMADRRFQPATEILVGFENGCFVDENTGVLLFEKMIIVSSYPQKTWTNYEHIGNKFENPELLKP